MRPLFSPYDKVSEKEKRADSESVLDVAQWTEGFQLKSSASQRNTWWIHGATAGTHTGGSSIPKKVYIVLAFKFAYLIQLRRRYTMQEIRHKIWGGNAYKSPGTAVKRHTEKSLENDRMNFKNLKVGWYHRLEISRHVIKLSTNYKRKPTETKLS